MSTETSCPSGDFLQCGLLGTLPDEEQADFEQHILACSTCQEYLEQLQADSVLSALRNRLFGFSHLSQDVETLAYDSSRLTPSGANANASVGAVAEFLGNRRFRIDSRFGSGGMGIVYQAYDRERQETVALKTFRRLGEEAAVRLTQEFRVLADLRHPNLVSLYELYAEGGRRFFTMELLDGVNFLAYVRGGSSNDVNRPASVGNRVPALRGGCGVPRSGNDVAPRFPERHRGRSLQTYCRFPAVPHPEQIARLRQVLPQLAAGLHTLHAAGKLHRDIKPSNIIVTHDGRLVLVDFGLVAEFQRENEAAGLVAGTASYMSPEQAAGRPLSPASDWYSVGVMLFESLTGELPFAGRGREVMARKQLEEPLPLDYWANDLPADLKELCAELLRADPAHRPTEDEIIARLSARCGAGIAVKEDGLPSPSPFNHDGLGRPSSLTGGMPAPQLFVGRAAELAALRAAYQAVAAGGAQVVLLRGPSGVGKTALCAEFFRQLAARDQALLFTGRCYERELVPYKAAESFIDSLVRYLERQPEAEVRGWCPPELAAAVHIMPSLRRLRVVRELPAEPVAAATDLPDLKRKAFAALRELLRRITARVPIVFFIDDLQWGGGDGPALFAEWLRGPRAPRLLFIGAHRDDAAEDGLWLKTWREVERTSGFAWTSSELTLGRLADDEARRLAHSLAQNLGQVDDSEALAATIAEHAKGHPLFLRELMALAKVEQDTDSDAPRARRPHHNEAAQARRLDYHAVPSLGEMIGRRLAALDADAYRLLEAVAVAGYAISLDRVYRAAELTLDRRAPLYALIDGNLARTLADDRLGKLVTYHDSVRETLLARSSAEALRDAHRRLAQAAAAEEPVDDEALVLHYQGAGDAELAARHAAAAADRAIGNLAFDLAIRCYRLAIESTTRSNDEHRTLRRKLAHALAHAGRSAEAGEEFWQLAQSAAGDDLWPLLYNSGTQFLRAGIIDRSLETLAPLFQRLDLRPPRRGSRRALAGLLCRRAWLALTGYRVRPRWFRRTSQRTLEQIDLCGNVGGVLTYYDILQGGDLITQTMHLALCSGDDLRVAAALASEAVMSALANDLRRTAAFVSRIEALAGRTRDDYSLAGAFCARGVALLSGGEWRPAVAQFDMMKQVIKRCPERYFEVSQAEWYRQYGLFYRGDLRPLAESVSDYLQGAIERRNQFCTGLFRLNITNLAWLAGDRPDDARRQLDQTSGEWVELPMVLRYYLLTSNVRLNLYLGQAAAAWRHLNDEWPWVVRSGLPRMPFFGIEAHHLWATSAVAMLRQGGADRAVLRALRRSVGYLERQRAAWPRALASLARAGLLAAQRDTPAAIAMYQSACHSLTAADMPLYAAAAQRRLGELLRDDQFISSADAALLDRGAAHPRRFAALLAGA